MTYAELQLQLLGIVIEHCPHDTTAKQAKEIAEDCAYMIKKGKAFHTLKAESPPQ